MAVVTVQSGQSHQNHLAGRVNVRMAATSVTTGDTLDLLTPIREAAWRASATTQSCAVTLTTPSPATGVGSRVTFTHANGGTVAGLLLLWR